jgi:hypothetical protein
MTNVYIHKITCGLCGEESALIHDPGQQWHETVCSNPLCLDADGDSYAVQRARFEEALRQDDFAIGDTFHLEGFQFEVIGRPERG